MNHISKYNIEDLRTQPEGQFLDRKRARIKTEDIIRHLVGFANASGGLLVIGIDNDGTVSGFHGNKPIEDFINAPLRLLAPTPIHYDHAILDVTNYLGYPDKILVFDVSPSTNSVIESFDREVYLRVGDSTLKVTYEQRRQLEYDKGQRLFEDDIVKGSSLEDVDLDLMQKYKERMGIPSHSTESVLSSRNFLINGSLTNAAVLLFAKNPTKYLPNARIKFLRYDGNVSRSGSEFNVVKEIQIEGPIPNMIEQSREVVNSQLRDFQLLNIDTGKFESMPEYPEFAWFEGIVNALTHRDYSFLGDYIRISMYDDRLEIFSPGKLPNIITLENMAYTRFSRNPRIARILSEFGWVKELNEGVKRIYSEMENAFLSEPQYTEPNENSVQLLLYNNILNRHMRTSEKVAAKISTDIFEQLNEEERRLIQYAYTTDKITVKIASELLSRSPYYSRNLLRKMEKLGLLIWHGSGPNDPTQYYVFFDR